MSSRVTAVEVGSEARATKARRSRAGRVHVVVAAWPMAVAMAMGASRVRRVRYARVLVTVWLTRGERRARRARKRSATQTPVVRALPIESTHPVW